MSETKAEPVMAPLKPEAPTAVDQLAALSEADRTDATPSQLVLRLKVGAGVQRFVIDVAEDSSWFGSWAWTPHTFPADGTPEGQFREFTITGLIPATLYAVRVTVHNTAGEAVGDVVRALTTLAPDAALTVWRARAKALQAERDAALAEKDLTADEATKRRAAEIAAVKEQMASLTSSTVTMQAELEVARENNTKLELAKERLLSEMEEVKALLAAKEARVAEAEDQIAKSTADAGTQVQELTAKVEELTAAHAETTTAFQAAQERLRASETTLRETSTRLDDALTAKVAQEELVADLNTEAASLRERISTAEEARSEADAAKEVVARELMAANAKVEALEASLEAAQDRVRSLEAVHADTSASGEAALAAAVRATEEATRKVALLEATIEGMKMERSASHADTSAVDTLKSENFALRAGYDEVVAAQDGVTKERDTAKAEAAEAARQLAAAQARVADLDRQNDELKQSAARERTQVDTLTAERNALNAQVERQQRELSEYPARLLHLEDDNARLQEEVKRVSAMASMVRVESEAREHFRSHLPEARLEEYVAHFVALKGMGFDTASAQAAVVKHPDSRDMQVTYCLSASR